MTQLHPPNSLLASLGPDVMAAIRPHLRMVELPQETVLFEDGDLIKSIFFPQSGLVSLVVDLASGETIEAGMIGRDGLIGGSSAFHSHHSLNRAIVQIAGKASVIDANRFRELVQQNDAFRAKVAHHEQFVLAPAQQSVACNVSHTLEARLARWLLRCRDLLDSEDIPLTQEFVAEMLGVQRTSVSLVAHTLQHAGLIRYRRGNIRLVSVDGLCEIACECYATLKAHAGRLLGFPLQS